MKIELKRIAKQPTYTIGKLYIDGTYFCDTLEDPDRGLYSTMPLKEIAALKIKGDTAIPTGTYKITLDVVSPKFSTRELYKTVCQGKVPRLLDVPGYDGILIHVGNTPRDTEGCLLLGENKVKGQVINSTETWKKFYAKVKGQKDITITIN